MVSTRLGKLTWPLVPLALCVGCSRGCKDEKPFVPFSIDASAPVSASAGVSAVPAASSAAPASSYAAVKAEQLPDNTAQVLIDGAAVRAPEGRSFRWIIKADFDADRVGDAAIWAHDPATGVGELLCVQGLGSGKLSAPKNCCVVPPQLATLPAGCTLAVEGSLIGAHTIGVVAEHRCGQPVRPAARSWSVIMPSRQPTQRLDITLDPAVGSDPVEVRLDGTDRDADQLDDVTVTIGIGADPPPFEPGAPSATASVDLRYFDRPAGLSRDPAEPDASFRTLASRLGRSAKKKNSWSEIAAAARRSRRLYAMLCGEQGPARVQVQGANLSCGASQAMADVDQAEFDAAIRSSEWLGALAALDRLERTWGATSRKATDARSKIDKAIATSSARATAVTVSAAQPSSDLQWSALALDADGMLLVRTAQGVVKIDPSAPTQTTTADEASLGAALSTPDKSMRLTKVSDPCDGSGIRAWFESPSDPANAHEVLLPIEGAGLTACAQHPLRVQPIAWGTVGLDVLVGHVPVTIGSDLRKARVSSPLSLQPWNAGSPRSPDGRSVVVSSPLGPVVVTSGKATRWKVEGLPHDASSLRHCVVANSASRCACLDGASVWLIAP